MAVSQDSPISLPNNSALGIYRRVTLSGGYLAYADASTLELGTLRAQTQTTDATGAVITNNEDGTQIFVASGAISKNAPFYAAANGKIAATGTVYLGILLEAASADGDFVQGLRMPRTGGKQFGAVAASTAVTNTTTETAFDQSFTIPAGTLVAGDRIRVRAQAIATATNSTDTLNLKLKLGSTVVVASGAVDVANSDIGYFDFDLVFRTVGASGTFVAAGLVALGASGTITAKAANLASTAVDTTADLVIAISATWSVANAGNSVRLDILAVDKIAA